MAAKVRLEPVVCHFTYRASSHGTMPGTECISPVDELDQAWSYTVSDVSMNLGMGANHAEGKVAQVSPGQTKRWAHRQTCISVVGGGGGDLTHSPPTAINQFINTHTASHHSAPHHTTS
jgi:hypothetical protein